MMKKTIIAFVVSALVLVSVGLWYFSSVTKFTLTNTLHFLVIILLVVFAMFFGFKRLSSARRGEPAEDELSRKIVQKAAALSYYISLYFWLFMIYIKDRVNFDSEELIGAGIIGMAIIFAVSWVVYYLRGIKNE